MICRDCGKQLQGGFGVGERPYKEYRCAECAMRNLDNERCTYWMRQLDERMNQRPVLENKKYRDHSIRCDEFLNSVQSLVKAVIK